MPFFKGFVLFIMALFCSISPLMLISQAFNLGTPVIHNYLPSEYEAGTQNWDISIGKSGIVYIANNEGMLQYDGEHWKLFPQSNATIARSLAINENNEIVVGGQDELGRFVPASNGLMVYESLLDKIPNSNRSFADIWNIIYIDSTIYYQNYNSISKLKGGEYKRLVDILDIGFMADINGSVIFNHQSFGLYTINDKDEPEFIEGTEFLRNKQVIDVIQYKDSGILIFTVDYGIYEFSDGVLKSWSSNATDYLKQNGITAALKMSNGNYAIGTRLGGVVVLDNDGKAIYALNKSSGLQNNNINALAEDGWGNLWVATYYGVDLISFSISKNIFYPDGDQEGGIYDIAEWNGNWWFGTSNGLYYLPVKDYYNPFEELDYKFVENSSGQVWGLDVIDEQLFVAHHNGAFQMINNQLKRISTFFGAWKFVSLDKEIMAVGAYDGIYIFRKDKKQWLQESKVKDLNESSRILMCDRESDLWMSHPYRGVFKLSFSSDYSSSSIVKYEADDRLVSTNENYVFDIFGIPYITNNEGIFKYDFLVDQFKRDSTVFKKIGEDKRVRKLLQTDNVIWYIAEEETGYVKEIDHGFESNIFVKRFPSLKDNYVGGFENLFPIDSVNQFICTNKGVFYHFDNWKIESTPFQAFISEIKSTSDDKVLVSTHFEYDSTLELSYIQNDIEFNFRTNGKVNDDIIGYSYMLEGIDDKWSEFEKKSVKEYTNLNHGEYVFKLRAMDKNGLLSEFSKLKLNILPPWYLSNVAVVIYVLLVLMVLVGIFAIPQQEYKKNTAKLVKKQEESEMMIETIKKEKFENEIAYKNKELAVSTLHLLQKNQTLENLRSEINGLIKNIRDTEIRSKLKNTVKILKSDLRLEDDWGRFSFHFDQVHYDFIKKLKSKYPDLTTNDHKMCAYLKMNLSTKEIAPLLNISVRGVEISRYRLRKKLGLDRNVNLNNFMNKF